MGQRDESEMKEPCCITFALAETLMLLIPRYKKERRQYSSLLGRSCPPRAARRRLSGASERPTNLTIVSHSYRNNNLNDIFDQSH